MTHITCSLTAKNRYQLRNPTLGKRVWATFYMLMLFAMTGFDSCVEQLRLQTEHERELERGNAEMEKKKIPRWERKILETENKLQTQQQSGTSGKS